MTGVSRSLSLHGPIAVDEIELPDGRAAFAVGGTPADCVRFAALGLAGDPPDVVVSGPNSGLNLGDDVAYSGTVAAALEGAMLGLPGSRALAGRRCGAAASTPTSWVASPSASCRCSPRARSRPASSSTSTPRRVRSPACAWRASAAGATGPSCGRPARPRAAGATTASTAPGRLRLEGEPGTDIAAVADGFISLTPLRFDLFADDALAALNALLAGGRMTLHHRHLRSRRHAHRHRAADRRVAPACAHDRARARAARGRRCARASGGRCSSRCACSTRSARRSCSTSTASSTTACTTST